MKKVSYLLLILLMLYNADAFCQDKNLKISGSYFGETITHPGFTISAEKEKIYTEKVGVSTFLELGYYHHPRNHDSWFAGINRGFRQYYHRNFFLEQYLGIGTVADFYNEDVWHIENGNAVKVSRFGNFNVMPSITLGAGYLVDKSPHNYLFWVRPRLFWQFPYNNLALPHLALQVGFSYTFKDYGKGN
jgi:hypothetical protein